MLGYVGLKALHKGTIVGTVTKGIHLRIVICDPKQPAPRPRNIKGYELEAFDCCFRFADDRVRAGYVIAHIIVFGAERDGSLRPFLGSRVLTEVNHDRGSPSN